jgi:hypothetical protein
LHEETSIKTDTRSQSPHPRFSELDYVCTVSAPVALFHGRGWRTDIVGEGLAMAGFELVGAISDRDPKRACDLVEALRELRAAGMIIAPCGDSLPRAIALLRQMPCAQLGAGNRSFDVPTMTLDDRPGAALAVSRPVQLGHRRMALLGGAGGIGSHGSSTGRGHSPLRADTGRGTGCASGRPSGAGTAVDHGFRRSGPVPLRGTRRDRHRLANRQACPGGRAASVRARPSGRRFQTSRPLHRNPRRSAHRSGGHAAATNGRSSPS